MFVLPWRLWPWALFLLVLPFGEGSGSPEGLLVAHLVFLLAVASAARRGVVADRRLAGAAAAFLGAAALAGALGGYRFGSLLAIVDLAVVLATLVTVEALARVEPDGAVGLLPVVVVAGIVQAFAILGAWAANGFGARGPGTLLNSDHAAAYLLLAFWAALAGIPRREKPFESLSAGAGAGPWPNVFGAAAVLLLAASVLQASRGALIALVAGGTVYLVLRGRAMAPRVQTAVVAVALGVVACAGTAIAYRFATSDDPYRWDRLRLWSVALSVARQHPWLGAGPGVFSYVTAPLDLARAEWPVRFAKHVEATHSDYLRVLAETGVLGAAACLGLLVLIVARAWTAARRRGPVDAALAAALAGLLCHAAVENLSARPAVSYTGALMVALLLARTRADEDPQAAWDAAHQPGTASTRRIAGRVLFGGLLVWAAIVLVVAPYLGYRAFMRFKEGGPRIGEHYAAAVYWSPLHSDYRAALAEAVLAARAPGPADLAAGFGAIEEARALKPVDPRYLLLRARLARAALVAGPGEADWVRMADEDYAAAVALDPLRPQAHLERGWMRETLGDPATALKEADAALASEPNSFEARRLRTVALVGLGRIDEARREAAEARRRHAETASLVPSNAYEAQVLRWDLEAWSALYARLNRE